jgi:Kdo2-lipid IVA 3' secondary acyltransferase
LFSKEFKNAILLRLAPRIIYFFFHLLLLTCKKRVHSKNPDYKSSSPVIIAFWHGEIFSTLALYRLYIENKNIDFLISEHKDGEFIARALALFGGGTIRGSSTRGGIKALKQAFKAIDQHRDIGITPDGPKGPRHSVADGMVLLSQKKQVPIVTLNFKPSSFWKANSWDHFVIPKPFSTIDFYIGEPFLVSEMSLEEAKSVIQKKLKCHAI